MPESPIAITVAPPEKIPFWHDETKRAVVYQIAILGMVALFLYYIISNTTSNLQKQSIATGFGFLSREASFEIGEPLISYTAADTYLRALVVGALNTIKVSFIGIVITIILGTFIGIARLSSNWLVARLSAIYIEVMQNIPILLQLFFWYSLFHDSLPPPRQSLNPVPGVFLNNRGFYFPFPQPHPVYIYLVAALGIAAVTVWIIHGWAKRRQDRTGQAFPTFLTGIAVILGMPTLTWWLGGAPTELNVPTLVGFNFSGGISFSPEFAALLLGLVLYTAAFVAEIVRAGIQAVSKGQKEAAMSIGLRPSLILSLVILPQALRVIIPPLTSQMLNLTKNSTLAVAIGYPDFVSVTNTTINQTGQAIEGVALIMIVYLFFSLVTSAFMNWYNKKTALVQR